MEPPPPGVLGSCCVFGSFSQFAGADRGPRPGCSGDGDALKSTTTRALALPVLVLVLATSEVACAYRDERLFKIRLLLKF
jgi:hypothetical protein